MLGAVLVVLLAADAAAPASVTRQVTLGAYTKKAAPVEDLAAADLDVDEAGRPRTVLGMERDRRALDVAVVLDSSATVAAVYRSELVGAVLGFWRALPEGTSVAVFTSGPPSRVVDFGSDVASAESRLLRVATSGKNYAFEAIADASKALAARRPPRRRVVVYVGASSIEASRTRTAEAMQALGQAQAVPMIVLVTLGGGLAAMGGPSSGMAFSWDVEGFFQKTAQVYGGAFTSILSAQAAAKVLALAAADLTAQYCVRYESAGVAAEATKVKVRRKDVKLRVGRPQMVETRAIAIGDAGVGP
jgi:hypothetical protein